MDHERDRPVGSVLAEAAGVPATVGPTPLSPAEEAAKRALLVRLRRIEGQVRGLQRLIEDDTYCIDVLTQISATTRALESVAVVMLEEHLSHCVAHAIAEGGEEADVKVKEASRAIARFVRS